MTILVTWKKSGEQEQSREHPDERLQELMDRAHATFGTPGAVLTVPSSFSESTSSAAISGLRPTKTPRRRNTKGRA